MNNFDYRYKLATSKSDIDDMEKALQKIIDDYTEYAESYTQASQDLLDYTIGLDESLER